MLKNYIKIAVRNIYRQRTASFINFAGLSIGMALSILILLLVRHELSYDTFHSKSEQIYRVLVNVNGTTGVMRGSVLGTNDALLIDNSLPFVIQSTHIAGDKRVKISIGQDFFFEEEYFAVDSSFLEVFDFKILQGSKEHVLKSSDQVVITRRFAEQYFGENWKKGESLLGETLQIDNQEYHVEGVLENPPSNSHIQFNILLSNHKGLYYDERQGAMWLTKYFVSNSDNVAYMKKAIIELLNKHKAYTFTVQPLKDIHLYTHPELGDLSQNGDVRYVYIFSSIALLILLSACFNYTNLTIARYVKRTKEVGIRKVNGASKSHLIRQFFGETFFFAFFTIMFAGLLVELSLPKFNELLQKQIALDYYDPITLLSFLGVLIFVSIVSGSYPALFLSSFKSTLLMSKSVGAVSGKKYLSKVLVVFQLVVSLILIISAVTIHQQLDFIQNERLGINNSGVIILNPGEKVSFSEYAALKNSLLKNSSIEYVASGPLPERSRTMPFDVSQEGEDRKDVGVEISYVDYGYNDILQFQLIAGRHFNPELMSDIGKSVLLNEAAMKLFGKSKSDICSSMLFKELDRSTYNTYEKDVNIIGVVKDFHFKSFKEKIEPLIIVLDPELSVTDQIGIRYATEDNNVSTLLSEIKSQWNGALPHLPFEYSFLDQEYDKFYKAEHRLAEVFVLIAFFAILISALGLFGLSLLTIEGRKKEISIRKVLGASSIKIGLKFVKDYTLLVVIGVVVAIPVTWFLLKEWLSGFAYRVDIGVLTFGVSIGIMLLVCWSTVAYHARRASVINPVDNLKEE